MRNSQPSPPTPPSPPLQEVERLLEDRLRTPISDVAVIGAGAWSVCFGFRADDRELVVRFGHHRQDFEMDRRAAAHAGPRLPIPAVLMIGRGLDLFYAVSERAFGPPLEQTDQWDRLLEPTVDLLEALRTADLSTTSGWGPWGPDGNAAATGWRQVLLAVDEDRPGQRTHGWSQRLRQSPEDQRMFDRAYQRLQQVADDDVPRSLIHSDLINRNVHTGDGRITGVFDWGCSLYGDHLYDLAWFQFWAPWFPNLDIDALDRRLQQAWADSGHVVVGMEQRLTASHLHIGLIHLAYSAFQQQWQGMAEVRNRMAELIDGLGPC